MIELTRERLGDFDAAASKEWLVTNGLGGFAAGTLAGANTRRYHGLLFAALRPPLERTLLVAKLDVTARQLDATFDLATNEFADGTIAPEGYRHIESFTLDGTIPTWRYRLTQGVLEQRIWMAHGENTTYVEFGLVESAAAVELDLVPLCTYRDYHWQLRGARPMHVSSVERGVAIDASGNTRRFRILSERGAARVAPDWYWSFKHRAETERGLDDREDLFRPAVFSMTLAPGERAAVILTAESHEPMDAAASLERERARQRSLLEAPTPSPWGEGRDEGTRAARHAPASQTPPPSPRGEGWDEGTRAARVLSSAPDWIQQLVLAADQFIVERHDATGARIGSTVIAGYPWFSDWGRDTMIALPGLTLSTGRFELAASILRTFARYVSDGMLPNRFPDAGEAPEYNTVDATLWFFVAIDETLRRTRDRSLLDDLYPTLCSIVDWHRRGTRFGIHVDHADGLLAAGEPGAQLTWMDAKIGDWVVTPRTGKPVEINALWFNALTIMQRLALELHDRERASDFGAAAAHATRSFGERFWYERGGHLFDVIDSPAGDDATLRPNQLFAVSLRHPLITGSRARSVVDICERELWTPPGMRSLARTEPGYMPTYAGAPHERDAIYHQGIGWSWLLGAFARAHHRVHGDAPHALGFLEGIAAHLREACLGQVSEISDGDAPFKPRGCFAQAWGVAEILSAWSDINATEEAEDRREARERRATRR